jgi:predicted branched-subunit amino acid permease
VIISFYVQGLSVVILDVTHVLYSASELGVYHDFPQQLQAVLSFTLSDVAL